MSADELERVLAVLGGVCAAAARVGRSASALSEYRGGDRSLPPDLSARLWEEAEKAKVKPRAETMSADEFKERAACAGGVSAIARRLGIPRSTLSCYANGSRVVPPDVARRLREIAM